MERLRIATRQSPLAMWQAEHVAGRLREAHPGLEVELVPMTTRGDEILDRSLQAVGGSFGAVGNNHLTGVNTVADANPTAVMDANPGGAANRVDQRIE